MNHAGTSLSPPVKTESSLGGSAWYCPDLKELCGRWRDQRGRVSADQERDRSPADRRVGDQPRRLARPAGGTMSHHIRLVVAVSSSGVSRAAQMDFEAAHGLKQSSEPAGVVQKALAVRAQVNDFHRGLASRGRAPSEAQEDEVVSRNGLRPRCRCSSGFRFRWRSSSENQTARYRWTRASPGFERRHARTPR